jgi:uncharacterized repeat protein (TIGR04052 family)
MRRKSGGVVVGVGLPVLVNASGLLCAALAFLGTGVSCSAGESPALEAQSRGTVTLALEAPDGQTIDTVSYVVTSGAAENVLNDVLDVSSSHATVSVEIDLPAGAGYTIAMTATTAEGSTCHGSAAFVVIAGDEVPVQMTLVCREAEDGGQVVITTTVVPGGNCPKISTATVGPLTAGVGDSIALDATATNADASFSWSTTSGTIADPTAANTTLLCTAIGQAEVSLTVSDTESCSDSETFSVNCVENLCRDLGRSCHVVDPGSGVINECHNVGHANDAGACEARRDECVQACGGALCQTLSSLCQSVDPGSGPIHDCRVLGQTGDAAACFASGRDCFDLCQAAQQQRVPVTIQFAAALGDDDFACGRTYPNQGTPGQNRQTATPGDFRFYVQDLRLINAGGQEVPVALDVRAPWQSASVALLDFEDGQGACLNGDVGTNALITGTVPAGDYVGVAFRNGVPDDLNHDDPTTLGAPLRAPGMQWSWLSGFRFMRAQLMQTRGPAENVLELGSTSCSGDPVAGTAVCSRPNRNEVRLNGFNPATSTIVADIAAIFAQLNWRLMNECRGSDAVCETMFTAYGVDFDTGAALDTQQVYRVE